MAVHDYNVVNGGADRADLHRDDEGHVFCKAHWNPLETKASDRLTDVAAIDVLSATEVRDILAQIYRWMYWDSKTGRWDQDRDISGADTVQLLCELLPYQP